MHKRTAAQAEAEAKRLDQLCKELEQEQKNLAAQQQREQEGKEECRASRDSSFDLIRLLNTSYIAYVVCRCGGVVW